MGAAGGMGLIDSEVDPMTMDSDRTHDTQNAEAEPVTTATGAPPRRSWYRRPLPLVGAAACLVAVGTLALGIPMAAAAGTAESSSSAVAVAPVAPDADAAAPSSPSDSGRGPSGPYTGSDTANGAAASTQEAATTASEDESAGVVLIDTVMAYDDGSAAGTGMVLTADGLVLTNNHVVEDATEITVTIATTGESYTATLVGTDAEEDVALLQLEGASGLTTIELDQDDTEAIGDEITAVGNAEGGGVLMAADGTITDLESTVTTASEGSVSGESLDGMIEISADVVSGDSGGAVLDADGEVIGMTTAASSGSITITAYAIPIEDALALVDQMLAGDESGSVTLGYPAFVGVAVSQGTTNRPGPGGSTAQTVTGALIGGVFEGTPAAEAGLQAGDVVTAVDGTAIADGSALSEALDAYEPGDTVTLTWTGSDGTSRSASVTLIAGPVG